MIREKILNFTYTTVMMKQKKSSRSMWMLKQNLAEFWKQIVY